MLTKSKKWVPHKYQLTALSFLLSRAYGGLFLDPGLGKTSISLAAIKALIDSDTSKGVLMIAPLRVVYSVWPNEIAKWTNFNNISHTILHEDNKGSLWGFKKDIYLINPEGLPWLHAELLRGLKAGRKCPFDVLWIDESTKFKSHEAKTRFQLVSDMLPLFKRRYIMTGTPAPRGLLDLWSQIFILDKGKALKPNFYHYRNKYFYQEDWNQYNWIIKPGASEEIHELVAPLALEMSEDDYLDMPPIIFNDVNVQLPDKAFRYYKQMEAEFFLEVDGAQASAQAAAQASMKCAQIANGKVYEDIPEDLPPEEERRFRKNRKVIHIHKAKQEAILDLYEELNGKPLLVAYHFKHDLDALRSVFGRKVPYIGSGVSAKRAKQLERDWNAGKLEVLLVNPDSMSHGLNLQESGNDICWYSLTWNLENYIQLNKRLHRQGVRSAVRIHHLVAENTVDEAMLLRLGQRARQQKDLRVAIKEYRLFKKAA